MNPYTPPPETPAFPDERQVDDAGFRTLPVAFLALVGMFGLTISTLMVVLACLQILVLWELPSFTDSHGFGAFVRLPCAMAGSVLWLIAARTIWRSGYAVGIILVIAGAAMSQLPGLIQAQW